MGTRGLVFIRCRGRYFIYYNHWDSYPDGLGEAIVSKIPTDPEKYCEWLESMRKTYSRLCQQFEEHHLPVDVTKLQDGDAMSPAEQHAKCFLALDDRLEYPPIQTLLQRNDLFIEWTYTIDLDQEIFGVDESVFFILAKIPREGRWYDFLNVEGRRRTLREETPKEIIGSVTCPPLFDTRAKNRYRDLSIKIFVPKAATETDGILLSPHHHLLLNTFEAFYCTYRWLLDGYILRWKPECFSFREISFALLSLAAGEVIFECKDTLNKNYESDGYFLIPDKSSQDNQQKLLPRFLSETHLPGKEPGSAPTSTSFWLGNVLVYLASRLDLVDVEEMSVSKAVDTGLSQGLKNFFAVVFSIVDFVLVQVQVNEDGRVHVQRSPLMNLFYFSGKDSAYAEAPFSRTQQFTPDSTEGSDSKDQSESDSKDESESPSGSKETGIPANDRRAFVALMHFFDSAANHNLMGAESKIFPNEILATIMQSSDIHTYLALAKASAYCRELRCRKFPVNNDYILVGVGANEEHGKWILEDRQTGERISTRASTRHYNKYDFGRDDKDGMELGPMINVADTGRQSIIDRVTLYLPGVDSKDPPYTKKFSRPVEEGFYRIYGFRPEDETKLVFNIPEYAYPGHVEKAWGRYIEGFVDANTVGFNAAQIDAGTFPCLLPHRYRQLRMRDTGQLEAILRSPCDESPEEWQETERFAIYQILYVVENDEAAFYKARGRLFLVAFGMKAKLFYYASYTENPRSVPPALNNTYGSQIAASLNDPNPANRFTQLIPGPEPFDIRDADARAQLERWIKAFSDGIQKGLEYDPITETYLPLFGTKKPDREMRMVAQNLEVLVRPGAKGMLKRMSVRKMVAVAARMMRMNRHYHLSSPAHHADIDYGLMGTKTKFQLNMLRD
ncbi:hypothetical protein PHISCL_06340 [Aspergillus sclerotialis]|uniref:F-box domain protein n=1 Tax=Aspergillus sclerotialis TaxID=2070753 RepID=A0A3A2ZGC8_9EURO|nr:hypothetical protein PHISCL_06340 [Aspergillus sclerotialis]